MFVVEWLEAHELFRRVFDTYNDAEDFALSLLQYDLIVVSLYQSF